jgi:uncharacterized membrane protein
MDYVKQWLVQNRRQAAVVASLVFSTAVCIVLLALRGLYAQSLTHADLLWNLFLAWLPMLSALVAYNLHRRSRAWTRRWARQWAWLILVPCLAFWLLFFPNAPYILTDMLHLQWPQYRVPVWYDLILLVAFAWTGAFLGLVSLYLMQGIVRRAAGRAMSWLFTLVVLALAGFGVYLGRFPRWNSWDVLTNPAVLMLDIWGRLTNPLANSRAFVFSALFSLCLVAMYLMLVAVMDFHLDEAS